MIRVVHSGNKSRFAKLLDRQFRLRHEIFVKGRGWNEFEVDGIYEKDPYDDEFTSYVIAVDQSDNVAGGFRLYPTILPHMLSEQFPNLVDRHIIQRRDLLELTRFAMRKTERRSSHYFELLLAIQEHGLAEGLMGYTSVINTLRIPVLQSFGFDIEPLGLPQTIDGETVIAVLFHVSEDCFSRVRKAVNIHTSVLESTIMERQIA
ncbi:acyl-homoserine-lactone synthase [uncultured Bradyrhizobium sp.]|uniref:acyl-homoserine-lactone synthase n=1 Tax=uncultured Bradyrhizobium sp. TaxID=199684 RepID=UPI0035CAC103